jgi:hypothetical protein
MGRLPNIWGAVNRQHGTAFVNPKQMELHGWAVEYVNVRFETTYEDQTLMPPWFRMAPNSICANKHWLFNSFKQRVFCCFAQTSKVAPDVLILIPPPSLIAWLFIDSQVGYSHSQSQLWWPGAWVHKSPIWIFWHSYDKANWLWVDGCDSRGDHRLTK